MIFLPGILKERVAIVTGGGTGIGRAIAVELAELGADVVVASRDLQHLEPTAADIRALGRRALAIPTDIRVPTQIEALAEQTVAEFGKIDIHVNNAGGQYAGPAEELSVEGWRGVIDLNLSGTFYCAQAMARQMMQTNGGAIVNIVANFGLRATPGLAHSAAARAGVINLTRTLALEWAKYNIRVNAVAPGVVMTEGALSEMLISPDAIENIERAIPLKWLGTPEDIAHLVTFLVSDAAAYITGETIAADGGNWHGHGLSFVAY
ncbi:MAG TPA: glucose 1-dehydrogenase [Candidatus Tectomicrobia bacterium]|nr:glucose 1-dehydrogenase [Candidatus Tectomicrobia bacterium]